MSITPIDVAHFGLQTRVNPRGPEISEKQAFDILCAKCLEMEPFPEQVKAQKIATGWAERMAMVAQNFGWTFTFTIKDR